MTLYEIIDDIAAALMGTSNAVLAASVLFAAYTLVMAFCGYVGNIRSCKAEFHSARRITLRLTIRAAMIVVIPACFAHILGLPYKPYSRFLFLEYTILWMGYSSVIFVHITRQINKEKRDHLQERKPQAECKPAGIKAISSTPSELIPPPRKS